MKRWPIAPSSECLLVSDIWTNRMERREEDNLGKCTAEGCEAVQDSRNNVSEHRSGLGSVLWIRSSCGSVNKIQTSKSHMAKKYGVVFDVNTKAAAGMVHAGMTFKEVERFACNLEIPAETTLKRREREIGPAIEEVANATCKAAAALENELTVVSAEDSEVGFRRPPSPILTT